MGLDSQDILETTGITAGESRLRLSCCEIWRILRCWEEYYLRKSATQLEETATWRNRRTVHFCPLRTGSEVQLHVPTTERAGHSWLLGDWDLWYAAIKENGARRGTDSRIGEETCTSDRGCARDTQEAGYPFCRWQPRQSPQGWRSDMEKTREVRW